MNKKAHELFDNDKDFVNLINQLAIKQFNRRKTAYAAESLFEAEDIEQELWCAIFESNAKNKDILYEVAKKKAEAIARRGDRKNDGIKGFVEIPISQLPKEERHQMENLFYSSYADDRDFD